MQVQRCSAVNSNRLNNSPQSVNFKSVYVQKEELGLLRFPQSVIDRASTDITDFLGHKDAILRFEQDSFNLRLASGSEKDGFSGNFKVKDGQQASQVFLDQVAEFAYRLKKSKIN